MIDVSIGLILVTLLGLLLLLVAILLIDTKYFDFLYKASIALTVGGATIMAFLVVYHLLVVIVRLGG